MNMWCAMRCGFWMILLHRKRLGLEAKGCCVGCIVKGQYGGFGWNRDGRGLMTRKRVPPHEMVGAMMRVA